MDEYLSVCTNYNSRLRVRVEIDDLDIPAAPGLSHFVRLLASTYASRTHELNMVQIVSERSRRRLKLMIDRIGLGLMSNMNVYTTLFGRIQKSHESPAPYISISCNVGLVFHPRKYLRLMLLEN